MRALCPWSNLSPSFKALLSEYHHIRGFNMWIWCVERDTQTFSPQYLFNRILYENSRTMSTKFWGWWSQWCTKRVSNSLPRPYHPMYLTSWLFIGNLCSKSVFNLVLWWVLWITLVSCEISEVAIVPICNSGGRGTEGTQDLQRPLEMRAHRTFLYEQSLSKLRIARW